MRKIVLAALLAAVAMPAWAFNDEKPQAHYSEDGTDWRGYGLCRRTSDTPDICMMLHSTEDEARRWARLTLDVCEQERSQIRPAECTASRAYIKQRWGY